MSYFVLLKIKLQPDRMIRTDFFSITPTGKARASMINERTRAPTASTALVKVDERRTNVFVCVCVVCLRKLHLGGILSNMCNPARRAILFYVKLGNSIERHVQHISLLGDMCLSLLLSPY